MTDLLPEQITRDKWPTIFTDVALWSPAVRHLWAASPVLRERTGIDDPKEIASGFPGTCAVFIVDKAAVVKFFPPFVQVDYQHERTVLEHAANQSAALPRLFAADTLNDRIAWPYLVTAYESGRAWRDQRAQLSHANQLSVAAELGRTVRDIHGWALSTGDEWPNLQAWARMVQKQVDVAPDKLAQLSSWPAPLIEQAADLLSTTDWNYDAPCLVNSDLTEDHILIEEVGGKWHLSCVLDWADAEVADPFYEWVALWFGFCHRNADLFRAAMVSYETATDVDAAFIKRMLAFTMIHRFGPQIIADVIPVKRRATLTSLTEVIKELFLDLV